MLNIFPIPFSTKCKISSPSRKAVRKFEVRERKKRKVCKLKKKKLKSKNGRKTLREGLKTMWVYFLRITFHSQFLIDVTLSNLKNDSQNFTRPFVCSHLQPTLRSKGRRNPIRCGLISNKCGDEISFNASKHTLRI